jgi:hypothetical protein
MGILNKNVCARRPYDIEGVAFGCQVVLSIPAPSFSNSFLSSMLKYCVVHAQLHKKRSDNSLYLPGLSDLQPYRGRIDSI